MNRNLQNVPAWFTSRGDDTHAVDYNLNENSTIMDLGGFTGVWVKKMIQKYNPNVYVIEPIGKFYDTMVTNLGGNEKVNLLKVGVGSENKKDVIYLKGDETSSQSVSGEAIEVEFVTMEKVLGVWGLSEVDLLQINIEGDEYPLLEHMLTTGVVNKFKNIQIQFHMNYDDFENRRTTIREGLKNNGFKLKYDFPFVWESWGK